MQILEIVEKGKYASLSNYAFSPFVFNDETYNSILQAYYMYLLPEKTWLFSNAKTHDELQNILGHEIYKIASTILIHKKYYNFHHTFDFLRSIVYAKVMAHPAIQDLLIHTGGAYLSVINRNDLVLGCGKSRMGLNLTGLMLMQIRDHLTITKNPIVYDTFASAWRRIGFVEDLNDSICEDPVNLPSNT